MKITQKDLDNWFSYHAPTPEKMADYERLRQKAKEFAELFNDAVPDCADKTAAMRHLRETVMAMNLAIACHVEQEQNIQPALVQNTITHN